MAWGLLSLYGDSVRPEYTKEPITQVFIYKALAHLDFVWCPFSTKASRANSENGKLIIADKFFSRIRIDWNTEEKR